LIVQLRAERDLLLEELGSIRVRLQSLFAEAAAFRENARHLKREREALFPATPEHKNEEKDDLDEEDDDEDDDVRPKRMATDPND
jgi:uncharacterized coiled-coil DUF342 family protein